MSALVKRFLEDLREGRFPLKDARKILVDLRGKMSPEELVEATAEVTQQEAKALEKEKQQRLLLLDILPDGWIKDYALFTQISESPDAFHVFSALAALTHLSGRAVYVSLGISELYAPLNVFLVSPPGQARRSSAIRLAASIGADAGASILSDTFTPEGLLEAASVSPHLLLVADEAATVLNKVEYMQTLPQILCALLDCPPKFDRKLRKEQFSIASPTVNILIGCAPEWIANAMPKTAIGGGLFSRVLIVFEQVRKTLIPFPDELVDATKVKAARRELSVRARVLTAKVKGRLRYDNPARKRFVAFYEENDVRLQAASDKIQVYLSRKQDHLHRLIMGLMVSQGREDLVCDAETIERALLLLDYIEPGIAEAYKFAGLEAAGRQLFRVLTALKRLGGCANRSELLRAVDDHLSAKDLDAVIATLEQRGDIEIGRTLVRNRFMTLYKLRGEQQ